ncbi:hypothetical protein [Cupriavidus basilensis]|uniref:hypothetical protein n=1 Tax=Cupriavidus basilensis TaxID=68895 RepID=UPI0023E82DCE|nr:hypothetical protein [Cupriavidus basilensis]MDF3880961.1 hypothetical protein [Cupriavidus basilensis]
MTELAASAAIRACMAELPKHPTTVDLCQQSHADTEIVAQPATGIPVFSVFSGICRTAALMER